MFTKKCIRVIELPEPSSFFYDAQNRTKFSINATAQTKPNTETSINPHCATGSKVLQARVNAATNLTIICVVCVVICVVYWFSFLSFICSAQPLLLVTCVTLFTLRVGDFLLLLLLLYKFDHRWSLEKMLYADHRHCITQSIGYSSVSFNFQFLFLRSRSISIASCLGVSFCVYVMFVAKFFFADKVMDSVRFSKSCSLFRSVVIVI